MDTIDILGAVLKKMLDTAEEIYKTSDENYPKTRGPRRGIAVVSIKMNVESGSENRWLALSDNFGKKCYREPKQLNGRDIDLGCSNEGIIFGKIAYSRRTHKNSGCSASETLEGESFWRGNMFLDDDPDAPKYITFGFSGFTELDDEKVAKAGREEYHRLCCYNG